jgi:hypothetical protein
MNDFLLIFRRDPDFDAKMTPEQMQQLQKPWMDWMGGLAAQGKLVDSGNRLRIEGKVVQSDGVITNGPYVEVKEAIGGYTMIRAASLEEAAELSKGCPILTTGGSVEVREILPMQR